MGTTARILLASANERLCTDVMGQLAAMGHVVELAGNARDGIDLLESFSPELVIVDLQLPDDGGGALLERARVLLPGASFIGMAPTVSTDSWVEALRHGADRLITYPVRQDALQLVVERSLEKPFHARAAQEARSAAAGTIEFNDMGIIGAHPTMQQLFTRLRQVAQSRSTVLLQGETGTGKELIAKSIHQHSMRAQGPLVRLNCAALAESVLESELFGHERGAFTGASGQRKGRFEQAHGGTLFLDELSEMSPAIQVKLLRFLQEREFERVGGNETVSVDVRVVAATNQNLRALVDDGRFREDLYFRLRVVVLEVPPLRARPSDIPLLVDHFLRHYSEENDKAIEGVAPDAATALLAHPWPGNVRELQHAVEQAVVLAQGKLITLEDLPIEAPGHEADPLRLLIPGVSLAEVERFAIERTLEAVGGSITKAAAVLGISKRTIQYRLQEWEHDRLKG